MNKNEFKELFLKLTEYTIPFGEEEKLEKYLPNGFKRDAVGNYYYEIGESETLFTTHLDTYSQKYEKVNHVIHEKDPFIISTDETTILGGDNKLGNTILIGMINNNIPGTYYFFIGEEPILSGGVYGSKNALKSNPNFFKKFKRCIAFDRRGYGSVVVRQMARMCCSPEFANSISEELKSKGGIKLDEKSGYGYYTDTAVFMDVIPECTNISAGGFNEHYKTEWVNLNYTYIVYKTALKIDWESLPTERSLETRFKSNDNNIKKKFNNFKDNKLIDNIKNIFDQLGLINTRHLDNEGKVHLTFSKWLEDFDFDVHINNSKIYLNDNIITYNDLLKNILKQFSEEIVEEIEYYLEILEKNEKDKQSIKAIQSILNIFNCKTLEDFDELLDEIL